MLKKVEGKLSPFSKATRPIHTVQVSLAEAVNCSFELLLPLPYLPSSDFFLLLQLKSYLRGK